jgi:hypothetical protein
MATRKRLVVAWLAGTLLIYVWGALSHMVMLKGAGFSRMPDEERVVTALHDSLETDGLYLFPSPDFSGRATPEETAAWERRFVTGPTGMILYHPAGSSPVSGQKLAIQLIADMIAAAIAVHVIQRMRGTRWANALTVGLLGVFAVASVATIFWNWYGFPHAFFVAQCIDMIVGWSLTGVAIAAIVASRSTPGPNVTTRLPRAGQHAALADALTGEFRLAPRGASSSRPSTPSALCRAAPSP